MKKRRGEMTDARAPQKPPAFQFYAKDFLNGTTTMSLSEVGAYIRLLAWSWDNGPLPLEERQIARIAHATISELRRVWTAVGSKFVRAERGWINERLERQRHELSEFKARASDRGKAGAEKRWNKHASSITSSTAQAMQDPMQNDSSPICDLQTAEPTPKDQARVSRAREDGRIVAGGVAWNPNPKKPTTPLVGNHRDCAPSAAAACGRGLCVPAKLIREWLAQCGDDTAAGEATVRRVVEAGLASIPATGAIGSPPFDFWRAQWAHAHGVQHAAIVRPAVGKGAQTVDAVQRALARRLAAYEGGQS